MLKNRILGTLLALSLAGGGLVAGAGAAHADDDDRISCSGYATKDSQYRVGLTERDDDRLRAGLTIDSKHAGKKWTVKVYRGGTKVHQQTKRTARNGDVSFAKTFRADDDARIKVVAASGYGERLERVVTLDDDLACRNGKGVKGARYGYAVAERDDDRVTAKLRVNSPRKGSTWKATFYRDGQRVASTSAKAGAYGNVTLGRTFRADDDARVKVVATSGYGERIVRTIELD
ncbi:hypothetical protein ACH436_13355 [Isoptericola sp. NPDC019693]|uniref:hypothetical protein n=1 Tax=Isoptericola sp. NPDC019693 TaxID=3364009 RepID=UPI00379231CA